MAGVAFLAFVAGAAAIHFKWGPGYFFVEAFEAGKAWVREESRPPRKEISDQARAEKTEQAIRAATVMNTGKAYEGVTLVTLNEQTTVYLLDMEGKVVHRWHAPYEPGEGKKKVRTYVRNAKLFPNGDLLVIYSGTGVTPYGLAIAKIDKDSRLIWRYTTRATHHDFYVDEENGNIYALTHEIISRPLPGAESLDYPILADGIVTLSPDGEEIAHISLLEALRDSPYFYLIQNSKKMNKRGKNWDFGHANSIVKLEPSLAEKFPMFKPGDLLVSFRNLNALAVIDRDTNKAKWALEGVTSGQHTAVFLPNGNILVFDNQWHQKQYSRIIELDPVTKNIVWQYGGRENQAFFTRTTGMSQALPGERVLIVEAKKGRAFEITKQGQLVWDLTLAKPSGTVFSAYRYPAESILFLKE